MIDFMPPFIPFPPQTRTDMAFELVKSRTTTLDEWVSVTRVNLDGRTSSRINKPAGKYVTALSPVVRLGRTDLFNRLVDALCQELKKFIKGRKNCLVVGLGNPNMTADALGAKVASKIAVTRIPNSRGLSAICPSVSGITGVESFEIIAGVVNQIRPSLVIAVDSLCSASENRLATAFQISNAGITPGSGVSNAQTPLNRKTLGVEVISLGVPLVIYGSTLIENAGGKTDKVDKNLVVTPKDIDAIVDDCAQILATSINRALGQNVN